MAPFRPLVAKPVTLVARLSESPGQPNNRVMKQRRNHHTAINWDSKKETIIQLYTRDNKQAKDVIEILRSEFAFHTSRRQLFNKLSEWGVQKNKKRDGEDIQGIAESFEVENSIVGPDGIAPMMPNSPSEPALNNNPLNFPNDREMFDEIDAQGLSASRGLVIASPTHTPQASCSCVDAGPPNHFLQFSEISLEELDLRTPRLLSDDDTAPPSLSHPFSPQSTALGRGSAAIDIRRQSPTTVVFGSYNQLPSEDEDTFSPSTRALQETTTLLGGDLALRTPRNYPSLENVIRSIIKFVERNERIIHYSNGLQLKGDLESLFESAQRSLSRTHYARRDLGTQLSLVNNMISSAPTISIDANGSFRFPYYLLPNGRNMRREQRRTTARVGTTIFEVLTKASKEYSAKNRRYVRARENNEIYTCLKLVFKPKASAFALQIECPLVSSSFSSIPRLSIKNIVPSDSLQFKVAERGSVQDLMSLFASGQANIRDHDENGWSLLHHSLPNPPMCQFLVQSGLDVDEIPSFNKDGSGYDWTPLHISHCHLRCSETTYILLAGGADPMVETDDWFNVTNIIANSLTLEDFTLLTNVFNLSAHFGVSNARSGLGWTLLLSTFAPDLNLRLISGLKHNEYHFVDPVQKLKFLLSRGSHIEEKDFNGSNCLHVFFRSCYDEILPKINWLDGLIYAVQQGADAYSADINGVTVSQIAYSRRTCQDSLEDLGSYRGDLWDSVLHACGYNILEFRKYCPRTARYTEFYSRKDFESLWNGREHLCPYWDDNEWPAAVQPEQRVLDSRLCQKFICCCLDEVRWLDIVDDDDWGYHNRRDSESYESSDSDVDSDGEYDADDENDEAEMRDGKMEESETEIAF